MIIYMRIFMKRMISAAILLVVAFMFNSCNKDEEDIEYTGIIPDGLPVLGGVTLKSELEYYAEGTARILAFWENNTEYSITYGESWQLEKYDAKKDKWTIVCKGNGGGFTDIGIMLLPEWRRKHIYAVTRFDENIAEGQYRIKTYLINDDIEGDIEERQFGITAEFAVTREKSFLQKSELDFNDLENSREISIVHEHYDFSKTFANDMDFPVHVYKNEKTYDTTIVINGDEYYEIGDGSGKWGVVTCSFYVAYDGSKYLIYSYSRENGGKKHSYIGIFDLTVRKEIYRSVAYETYDIWVAYRREAVTNRYGEEDIFEAGFMEHEESEGGGISQSSTPGEIGYFKYENGIFSFYTGE